MITAIGVDIENVAKFSEQLGNTSFLNRIFTSKEIEYCLSKSLPAQSFAARFAAKEAVIKAFNSLSETPSKTVTFKDIEILVDRKGVPKVNFLLPDYQERFTTHLSLSHISENAVAFVLILSS